jgi:hypothetical protein
MCWRESLRSSVMPVHLVISTCVDNSVIGIVAALFLAAPGFVYGGYACKPEQRYSAWLLYCYGTGCFGAATVLTVLVASGCMVKAPDGTVPISRPSLAAPPDDSNSSGTKPEIAALQPSPAVSPSPPEPPRQFVGVTASHLWHLSNKHPSTEAQRLVAHIWGNGSSMQLPFR